MLVAVVEPRPSSVAIHRTRDQPVASRYTECTIPACTNLERLRKIRKSLMKIMGVSVEIRTKRLHNTSEKHYRSSQLARTCAQEIKLTLLG
jgi:hypothetical protein